MIADKGYEHARKRLSACDYIDLFEQQKEYNAAVADMQTAWENHPFTKRSTPKTNEAMQQYLFDTISNSSLHGELSKKHTDASQTMYAGYHMAYNGGMAEKTQGCLSLYINPHTQALPEVLHIIDECIGDQEVNLKLNTEAFHTDLRPVQNKCVLYFDSDDYEGFTSVLRALEQREKDLKPLLQPGELSGLLGKLRIPLMPGMWFVERPSISSWDTKVNHLINDPDNKYARYMKTMNKTGVVPTRSQLLRSLQNMKSSRNPRMPGLSA